MIVKMCNGSLNSWTYYEANEVTIRNLKKKNLGKFNYSYHGEEVDDNHPVLQISLCSGDIFKYVVVPGRNKSPIFLMGNNGKTIDRIN